MNSPRRRRLGIVLSHPIQYYSPWFRWMQSQGAIDFRVFYLWDYGVSRQYDPRFGRTVQWDVDLLAGYSSEFVPNVARDPGPHHFGGLHNPELCARLAAWQPDVLLLFGYKWRSHLSTIVWARRRRLPLVFRGDSHFLGRRQPWHRTLTLKWLYRQFSAFTYVGKANRAYFEGLGVPARRLFFAPHAVDSQLFDPADPRHGAAAAELRHRLRLAPGTRVVLFAGKLVPDKQPRELLQAFLQLAPADAALVFVGDGAEKAGLEDIAGSAPAGTVHFLPFANQSEMPARYLLCDLFVLPSRGFYETWGLAVNEAMRMGRPCLVSDLVGCQQDLVTPNETGWVFPAGEAGGLKRQLALALATLGDADAVARLQRSVADRIAGYSYAQTTDGLVSAVASIPDAR